MALRDLIGKFNSQGLIQAQSLLDLKTSINAGVAQLNAVNQRAIAAMNNGTKMASARLAASTAIQNHKATLKAKEQADIRASNDLAEQRRFQSRESSLDRAERVRQFNERNADTDSKTDFEQTLLFGPSLLAEKREMLETTPHTDPFDIGPPAPGAPTLEEAEEDVDANFSPVELLSMQLAKDKARKDAISATQEEQRLRQGEQALTLGDLQNQLARRKLELAGTGGRRPLTAAEAEAYSRLLPDLKEQFPDASEVVLSERARNVVTGESTPTSLADLSRGGSKVQTNIDIGAAQAQKQSLRDYFTEQAGELGLDSLTAQTIQGLSEGTVDSSDLSDSDIPKVIAGFKALLIEADLQGINIPGSLKRTVINSLLSNKRKALEEQLIQAKRIAEKKAPTLDLNAVNDPLGLLRVNASREEGIKKQAAARVLETEGYINEIKIYVNSLSDRKK